MPFPPKTAEWAAELGETLSPIISLSADADLEKILTDFIPNSDERSKAISSLPRGAWFSAKKVIAATLYYGLHIRYGFEEAIKTGNWTPWPDQSSEVNCYGQSIATYLVAQNCGLKPELIELVGLQQEKSMQRGGHSLVVVDVGRERPEKWVIDPAMQMYGPVQIGNNSMVVENLDANQKKTHRNDYRTKHFDFILKIINNHDEAIISHVEQLRANPETVLYPGQRMGIPLIDAWQSEEALEALWYLRFIPNHDKHNSQDRGYLVSRVEIERPGIKSRGLEYKIKINQDNSIREEKVTGYYCNGMAWTDFVNPIPMVVLTPSELIPLLEGIAQIPLKERSAFEHKLMKESNSADNPDIKAARTSFQTLQESEYGRIVSAISAVEALYQHGKGLKETYLTAEERQFAIQKYKGTDQLFNYYAKTAQFLKQSSKMKDRVEGRLHDRSRMLPPNRQEDPRMKRFLALETEEERLQHILAHKPNYIDDALDRIVFYDRRIKGKEAQVESMARSTFSDNYDNRVFSGYTRIFAEFLGHFAVTLPQLCLQEYKQKILDKLLNQI